MFFQNTHSLLCSVHISKGITLGCQDVTKLRCTVHLEVVPTYYSNDLFMSLAHSTTPYNTQVPCHRVPGAQTCLVFRPVWSASCSHSPSETINFLAQNCPRLSPHWHASRISCSLPGSIFIPESPKNVLTECLATYYTYSHVTYATLRDISQHCHKH